MKKILLIAFIAILFIGCQKEAQLTEQNGNFKVEFLFEKNGCKIYRFNDGRTVYWADCQGSVSEEHRQSNGKNSGYTVRVESMTTKSK